MTYGRFYKLADLNQKASKSLKMGIRITRGVQLNHLPYKKDGPSGPSL